MSCLHVIGELQEVCPRSQRLACVRLLGRLDTDEGEYALYTGSEPEPRVDTLAILINYIRPFRHLTHLGGFLASHHMKSSQILQYFHQTLPDLTYIEIHPDIWSTEWFYAPDRRRANTDDREI
ncbi:hypothetical protein M422DRAFT_264093 [Sphaerobolus stellatus SS14]|uniref:Uncharacterized protein n=1 Tax=Sphaerobolus stellatus (strain SS14) TaxID=990650 RepID=A0A0C9UGR7_SPHS4|nr:hypothetical protein M422DRAFT_264093 [Sphaerobolus stellatus SS14]